VSVVAPVIRLRDVTKIYPIIRKMGEAGLFGAAFPETLGGTDAGFFAVAAISEELSRLAPAIGREI